MGNENNLYLTPEYLDIMVEQNIINRTSADNLLVYMKVSAEQLALANKEDKSHDDGLGFKSHAGIPYAVDRYLDFVEENGLQGKITSVESIAGSIEENKNKEE